MTAVLRPFASRAGGHRDGPGKGPMPSIVAPWMSRRSAGISCFPGLAAW